MKITLIALAGLVYPLTQKIQKQNQRPEHFQTAFGEDGGISEEAWDLADQYFEAQRAIEQYAKEHHLPADSFVNPVKGVTKV